MTIDDRLSLYLELINCNYDLYLWEFDKDLNFIQTNWPHGIFYGDFLTPTQLKPFLATHITSKHAIPLILETDVSLLWYCGFLHKGEEVERCYLIGPIFTGKDSHMLLRKRLDAYNLSIELRSKIFRIFESIPNIPTNILTQYAVMLHQCLNNEKISPLDLSYQSSAPTIDTQEKTPNETGHAGIWYTEQQLWKMLADGDPRYKEAVATSFSLSSGIKTDQNDSLRNHKNNALVLLTICSRACMYGGLSPSIAYDLYDYYAKRIEYCNSLTATNNLTNELLEEYVSQVQKAKEQSHISGQVKEACQYIKSHISTPISISTLAKRTGYSEYYFSHKFKKEMGLSINEYIQKEKIEQAKLLLSSTNNSIQQISDTLAFGNRSYFYTCFQKHVGLSPSEYRSKYTMI